MDKLKKEFQNSSDRQKFVDDLLSWLNDDKKEVIFGGKVKVKHIRSFLNESYEKAPKETIDDWVLDKDLSTDRAKVYHNSKTNQTSITHTGTDSATDWGNNLVYGLFGKKGYKYTKRYKQAEEAQKKALKKYGAENLSTLGHSQSGLILEILAQKGLKGREAITLNKATRLGSNEKQEGQYDIRTSGDVVSALNPLQKKNKNDIVIKSKTYNPLTEHSPDVLLGLNQEDYIGHGHFDLNTMKYVKDNKKTTIKKKRIPRKK
jgi:hypothetical protein